jgi:hypothetical protein
MQAHSQLSYIPVSLRTGGRNIGGNRGGFNIKKGGGAGVEFIH